MTGCKDWTAAQLAESLDLLELRPHLTGPLSLLDEATLAFGLKYPGVARQQKAFAAARYAHQRSAQETGEYSGQAWHEAMAAARSRRRPPPLRRHQDSPLQAGC